MMDKNKTALITFALLIFFAVFFTKSISVCAPEVSDLPESIEITENTDLSEQTALTEDVRTFHEKIPYVSEEKQKIQNTEVILQTEKKHGATKEAAEDSNEEESKIINKPIYEETEKNIKGKDNSCLLSIKCFNAVLNIDKIAEEKRHTIPPDGIVLPETAIAFDEGESVFDVLQRKLKENKIHMEFVNTPIYNSVYIEGINNLYEFDAGELSGWLYKVNGIFPNYGCSEYFLKNGDKVEWVYTCDLGKDLGKDTEGGYENE